MSGAAVAWEMIWRLRPGGITQHTHPTSSNHFKQPAESCECTLFTICRLCCAVVPCPRATRRAGKPRGDCRGLKRAFCSLLRQMSVVKAARQVAVRPPRALPRPAPARRGARTTGLADDPARGRLHLTRCALSATGHCPPQTRIGSNRRGEAHRTQT